MGRRRFSARWVSAWRDWERSGHEWKVTMIVDVPDGDKHRSEGAMDLEILIYSGKLFKE